MSYLRGLFKCFGVDLGIKVLNCMNILLFLLLCFGVVCVKRVCVCRFQPNKPKACE